MIGRPRAFVELKTREFSCRFPCCSYFLLVLLQRIRPPRRPYLATILQAWMLALVAVFVIVVAILLRNDF